MIEVYPDTPVGVGKLTILGSPKQMFLMSGKDFTMSSGRKMYL